MRFTIRSTTFVLAATMLSTSLASADVVFDNFDGGGGFHPQNNLGAAWVGPGLDSGRAGARFTVPGSSSFTLDSIRLPISVQPLGSPILRVRLTEDSGTMPGATLEVLSENQNIWPLFTNPFTQTVTVNSTSHPTLNAGSSYWIVTEPTGFPGPTIDYRWFMNTSGTTVTCRQQQAFGGLPTDPWTGSLLAFPLAFRVNGTVIVSSPTEFDLASGTTGTFTPVPQSFNETRGVDITVGGSSNLAVQSMTLRGLYISTASATVGARIYASPSGALLASNAVVVSSGANQTVNVPIAEILSLGTSYRVAFFVSAGGSGGSGTMFDPAPPSVGGFPYVESTGVLTVNQAYSVGADAFPTNMNIFVPLITIFTGTTGVDEPLVADANPISLSAPFPNPFIESTSVPFTLSREGVVDLRVVDVMGRRVAAEDLGIVKAGRHPWSWNGTDSRGSRVAGGIYFIQLRVDGSVADSRKAVLVR